MWSILIDCDRFQSIVFDFSRLRSISVDCDRFQSNVIDFSLLWSFFANHCQFWSTKPGFCVLFCFCPTFASFWPITISVDIHWNSITNFLTSWKNREIELILKNCRVSISRFFFKTLSETQISFVKVAC